MKRLALVALVIGGGGCGGGGARPAPVGNTTDDAGVPPALFAALFVDGKAFTYDLKSETAFYDDTDPKADQSGMVREVSTAKMTCRVHGMQNFARAIAAKIECDDDADPQATPDGIWVATATGIWRLDSFPLDDAAIAALDPKAMVLAAQPVEQMDDTGTAGDDGGESRSVTKQGDGTWCANHSIVGGDESGDSICFAAGKGVVGGSAYFAGGSTKDFTYTLTGK